MKEFLAKNVSSGKYGQVWLDGEMLAEIMSAKAEIGYKQEQISMVGKIADGTKIVGVEPKGEMKIRHVNSFVAKKELEMVKAGHTPTHTVRIKIDDPDAFGAEEIVCYNCVLDKMILADFEDGKTTERSYAFNFDDWDLVETI